MSGYLETYENVISVNYITCFLFKNIFSFAVVLNFCSNDEQKMRNKIYSKNKSYSLNSSILNKEVSWSTWHFKRKARDVKQSVIFDFLWLSCYSLRYTLQDLCWTIFFYPWEPKIYISQWEEMVFVILKTWKFIKTLYN